MDDTTTAPEASDTILASAASDTIDASTDIVLFAPENTTAASVDGTGYDVVDGRVTLQNPEHVAELLRHGFTQEPPALSHSEPEPVIVIDMRPDFSAMTRDQIVNWLADNGGEAVSASSPKADLVAAANAHYDAEPPEA